MALKFEWDKSKAADNFDRHGVSFELAKEVFKDPFAVDRQEYGEERFVIIGLVATHFLSVAYTERQDAIRIISARRATKHEQETYLQENS